MPIINLKLVKGRTEDQKREFSDKATKLAVEILNVQPEWVTAGKLHSEKQE